MSSQQSVGGPHCSVPVKLVAPAAAPIVHQASTRIWAPHPQRLSFGRSTDQFQVPVAVWGTVMVLSEQGELTSIDSQPDAVPSTWIVAGVAPPPVPCTLVIVTAIRPPVGPARRALPDPYSYGATGAGPGTKRTD